MNDRWIVLLIAASAAQVAMAPGWVGAWRLDRARSRLVGPSIAIARTPRGYRFDVGATAFEVGDDGRDWPTVPTRTTSLRPLGPGRWRRVHKTNGREVDRSLIVVPPGGATMTIDTEARDSAGGVHRAHEVLDRIGAGAGLAGRWRSRTAGAGVADGFTVAPGPGGALRWTTPGQGQFEDRRFDGSAVRDRGPQAVPTVTTRYRAAGPDRFTWTQFVGGRPYVTGEDRLAGDRLIETSWPVAHPDERQVAAYARVAGPA